MNSVVRASPAEVVDIAPENLLIANSYLKCGNIDAVIQSTGMPREVIARVLSQSEVKRYIDTVFLDTGYRNRNNIAAAMDSIIATKLAELEEAELGSGKDIADLLQMAHKMRMDELAMMAKLEEARAKSDTIKNQTNIQINEGPQGNYGDLVRKILATPK